MNDAASKLVQAASTLMLRKGYVATSVDEICTEAGLTKGAFYHHFRDKEELGHAALNHYWESMQALMADRVFRPGDDPLQSLYRFLDFVVEIYDTPLFERSCLLGNFAQELSLTHESFRKACDQHLTSQIDVIEQVLRAAKELYAPDRELDVRALAESLIALIQGSILLSKSRTDHNPIASCIGQYRLYLQTLFGR